MNGEQFLTRYNIMTINTIPSFAGIRGGIRQNCKDVYFIRGIGCNDSYLDDIMKMDKMLYTREVRGTGGYLRLGELPKLVMPDEMEKYIRIYETWKADPGQEINLEPVSCNKELGAVFSSAGEKVSKAFCRFSPGASESMVKNFLVKIFYWADGAAANLLKGWRAEAGGKFVLTCNIKKQEFLFCYFLSLLGIDVLILSPEGELGVDASLLAFSKRMDLGECRTANIPGYHPEIFEENKRAEAFEDALISKEPETSQISDIFQRPGTWERPDREEHSGSITRSGGSAASPAAPIRVVIPGRNRGKNQTAGGQSPGGTAASGAAIQRPPAATVPGAPVQHPAAASGQGVPVQRPATASGQGVPVQRPAAASAQGVPVQRPPTVSVQVPPRQAPREPAFQSGIRQELAFEQLARLASSIVMISVKDKSGKGIGSGSGIMVGTKGYILTNFHVVNGGTNFNVQIEDDQKMYETDELIKYNQLLDMALIRINRQLTPIPVYKGSQPLVRGQKVVAIGSPLGLFNSVSDGIISGFRNMDEVDMIQFTAPISHGSSGGAVLNMFGEVIGISTAGIDSGQNLNLAVDYRSINPFIRGFIQV